MSKFTPGPWGIVDGLFISGPDGVEFASTKFDACEERREAKENLCALCAFAVDFSSTTRTVDDWTSEQIPQTAS